MSPQWEGGLELDSGDDHENENLNNDSFEASNNADAALLRPMFWSCVQFGPSGIMRSCAGHLLRCGWPAHAPIIVNILVLVMVCSNQDGYRT